MRSMLDRLLPARPRIRVPINRHSTHDTMKRLTTTLALLMTTTLAHAFPWYASGNNIRGAQLMTATERSAYVAKLQTMKNAQECQAFWTAHNQEIDTRAQTQHVTLPVPQGNPCEVMQRFGRFR